MSQAARRAEVATNSETTFAGEAARPARLISLLVA
jgi:hypothetical protein